MNPGAAAEPIEIEVRLRADGGVAMARDIRLGLTAKPKELSPKYFYDERGSQLFERITELEEYYPTRAEREILEHRSGEIVAAAGEPGTLVELGSGSAAKTRHLLSAMRDAGCLDTYVPVDISEEITRETADSLVEEYPGLTIRGLVCDFEHDLERIPEAAAAASSPSSAAPSATSSRTRAATSSPVSPPCWSPATGSCSVPTWSSRSSGSRPPTTTARGSPPSSTRTSCTCSTASTAATSTPTPSSTSPATTRRPSAWTSACARSPSRRCGSTAST